MACNKTEKRTQKIIFIIIHIMLRFMTDFFRMRNDEPTSQSENVHEIIVISKFTKEKY